MLMLGLESVLVLMPGWELGSGFGLSVGVGSWIGRVQFGMSGSSPVSIQMLSPKLGVGVRYWVGCCL